MPKLTDAAIACLPVKANPYEVSDAASPGLRLCVYPKTGRKVFILRFRRPGSHKSAKLTLGSYMEGEEYTEAPAIGAPLTLAAARKLAATALLAKAHGRDPAAERQAQKLETSVAPVSSFADALPAYLKHVTMHNRSTKETSDVLEGWASPAIWGDKPLDAITSQNCFDLIERCRLKGFPGRKVLKPQPCDSRARLAHMVMQGFFSWCLRTRRIERTPLTGVEAPPPPPSRDRVLDDIELAALWHCCNELSPWHASVIRLLLCTGSRLREISELKFAEINGDTILLGPSRTKTKITHTVYLSSLAQEVLAATPRMNGCEYVFSFGSIPVNGWSDIKQKLDKAIERRLGRAIPAWRIHDARRTFVSRCAELGVPIHVCERLIGHSGGSFAGVVSTYNRYSYAKECREAVEKLAAHVRGIIEPAAEAVRGLAA
jgi:integrase